MIQLYDCRDDGRHPGDELLVADKIGPVGHSWLVDDDDNVCGGISCRFDRCTVRRRGHLILL